MQAMPTDGQADMNRELRILMLEDTPTDAELIERELRKAGLAFTSRRVETRDSFTRALEEFHPDIVLSDYNLPDFNGMVALEIVRCNHPEVPVVMVTGALSDIEAVELIHAGAKDYVLKDRLARLAPAVRRALSAEQEARARKALEVRNERLTKFYRALSEVNQAIVRMDDESALFPLVCRMAVDFGGVRMAWIGRLNEADGRIEPVVSYGSGVEYLDGLVISSKQDGPEGRGSCAVAFRENRSVVVNDFLTSEMPAPGGARALHHGYGSSGYFPIPRAGKPFAVLSVYHEYPEAFDAELTGVIEEMSHDISFALDGFDRESERKRTEQELRIAATAFETQEGILITDRGNRILRVNQAFTRVTGYSSMDVMGKTPAILKSGRQNAEFYQSMWENLVRDKYWQGELWNKRKNGEIYPEWLTITAVLDEERQVTHYVGAFSDITLRKEAEDKIHQLAFHDPLTNLPNRNLLQDRLQHAMTSGARSHYEGALMFIDLDNFKILNDTRGHDIGDLLLVEVARRLQTCVRDSDTVARLGGDEFVVMLDELNEDLQQAVAATQNVGEKILAALNQPFTLQGIDYYSSASIGISMFHGEEVSVYELLKRADTAMYQAKSAGHNTLRFFDPETQAQLELRTALTDDLRQALLRRQFKLYYQVQIDDQGVKGAEALLRWQHPERGLVQPKDFIPIAEETGLIVPIGLWVLQTACEQLKEWQADPLTRQLQIAINVSARQFLQQDFVERVLGILKETGVDPLKIGLEFELTETLILHNIEESIGKMQTLRDVGIHFSLDDFGTGQSSLSYLKRLPLDQIKIDQSFVRDITLDHNDASIVRTMIGMAGNLGLQIIAEGVETEQQRDFLKRNGCHAFQGYLFGKPMPIEEFQGEVARFAALKVENLDSAREVW
ncbi:EAL domain-containing protein [Ferrovum sp.]|uniref:EAL domain-containing protein n=1 Tax=Ferrovum sp. TaxID=2609467 RepID=UPI00262EF041|nr:EAL domain-containing protein [Ferrovum sp.]